MYILQTTAKFFAMLFIVADQSFCTPNHKRQTVATQGTVVPGILGLYTSKSVAKLQLNQTEKLIFK